MRTSSLDRDEEEILYSVVQYTPCICVLFRMIYLFTMSLVQIYYSIQYKPERVWRITFKLCGEKNWLEGDIGEAWHNNACNNKLHTWAREYFTYTFWAREYFTYSFGAGNILPTHFGLGNILPTHFGPGNIFWVILFKFVKIQ